MEQKPPRILKNSQQKRCYSLKFAQIQKCQNEGGMGRWNTYCIRSCFLKISIVFERGDILCLPEQYNEAS